jgi:hypothetical protein
MGMTRPVLAQERFSAGPAGQRPKDFGVPPSMSGGCPTDGLSAGPRNIDRALCQRILAFDYRPLL